MKPLEGYTLLDFSPLLPGPWASEQLRQLGMRVIRIESPKYPDLLRMYPQAFDDINGGKETWTLDLKAPGALEEIKTRLHEVDVVLEAFRPGVMSRFGLGYDELSEAFPRLVYCSLTGYGQTGPLAKQAGHDLNFQALAGLLSYQGSAEPSPTSVQIADIAGGSYPAMVGILSVLLARDRTGLGRHIDISMAEGALALNTMAASETLGGQPAPTARTGVLNGGSFYGCYRCKDNRYLAFGGLEPKFFEALCHGLNRPEWVARFADFSAPGQAALKKDLAQQFATKPRDEWLQSLPTDCCLSPVLSLDEALSQRCFTEREMVVKETDGRRYLSTPIRFV